MLSYLSGVNQTNLKNKNMNNNEELGIYYPDAEIGKIAIKLPPIIQTAINTVQSQVQTAVNTVQSNVQSAVTSVQDAMKGINLDNAKHDIAKIAFTVPRGAFLILLRTGGALENTPVKINLAKEIAKQWASKGTRIKQKWYDLGGDPKELINVINMSSSSPTISGMNYLGIEPVTTAVTVTGTIAAAVPILAPVMEILDKAKDFINDPKNKQIVDLGKTAVKGLTDKMQKENPGQPAQTQEITNSINSGLPPITTPVTSSQGTNIINTAGSVIDAVKDAIKPPAPAKDNKMLYIIGGVAVLGLGALFLSKKK